MAYSYRFDERLGMSQGYTGVFAVDSVLLNLIPGAIRVEKATNQHDRSGTDWWVHRECGRPLSVDAKVREQDWRAAHPSQDDLALEVWSVVEKQRLGWTRDRKKQTDYILWLWLDTGRYCLVPFPLLLGVFEEEWQDWVAAYRTARQYTPDGGYHSECVFVPRAVIWRTIYERYA